MFGYLSTLFRSTHGGSWWVRVVPVSELGISVICSSFNHCPSPASPRDPISTAISSTFIPCHVLSKQITFPAIALFRVHKWQVITTSYTIGRVEKFKSTMKEPYWIRFSYLINNFLICSNGSCILFQLYSLEETWNMEVFKLFDGAWCIWCFIIASKIIVIKN